MIPPRHTARGLRLDDSTRGCNLGASGGQARASSPALPAAPPHDLPGEHVTSRRLEDTYPYSIESRAFPAHKRRRTGRSFAPAHVPCVQKAVASGACKTSTEGASIPMKVHPYTAGLGAHMARQLVCTCWAAACQGSSRRRWPVPDLAQPRQPTSRSWGTKRQAIHSQTRRTNEAWLAAGIVPRASWRGGALPAGGGAACDPQVSPTRARLLVTAAAPRHVATDKLHVKQMLAARLCNPDQPENVQRLCVVWMPCSMCYVVQRIAGECPACPGERPPEDDSEASCTQVVLN